MRGGFLILLASSVSGLAPLPLKAVKHLQHAPVLKERRLQAAAPLAGDVALTTVAGTVAQAEGAEVGTTIDLNKGENVYGPLEAGFSSSQDGIIESGLGCTDTSKCYSDGGIDVMTSEAACSQACGIALPREEGGNYYGFLDSCGGHTPEYHFHRWLSCLYDASADGHSTKVGEGADDLATGLYGMYEDSGKLPQLDACGGHYGVTPDSGGEIVYHNHVQAKPPFTFGCYGPDADGGFVSVSECRALYSDCDGSLESITTSSGTFDYDAWCPCYDASGKGHAGNGLNTGVDIVELPEWIIPEGAVVVSGSASGTASSGGPSGGGDGATAIIIIIVILALAAAAGVAICFNKKLLCFMKNEEKPVSMTNIA